MHEKTKQKGLMLEERSNTKKGGKLMDIIKKKFLKILIR